LLMKHNIQSKSDKSTCGVIKGYYGSIPRPRKTCSFHHSHIARKLTSRFCAYQAMTQMGEKGIQK
jgi:hypothetical protein